MKNQISPSKILDFIIPVREMTGNSVNSYEMDKQINGLMKVLDKLLNDSTDQELVNELVSLGNQFNGIISKLSIHPTANVWAKERHLKYSKMFNREFDLFKQIYIK